VNVTIARSDDWVGFYIDGKLKMQGHSIRLDDALDALKIANVSVEVPGELAGKLGRFPARFDTLAKAIKEHQ
jgi:hypothetical protein